MTIGEKLRKVRLSLGLNRKEFAHGIINESYLAIIENGKSKIRAADLIAILQKNNLSVLSFLDDFGNVEYSLSFYECEADNAFFAYDIVKLTQIKDVYPNILIKEVIQLMIAKLNDQLTDFPSHIKVKIKKIFWQMEEWNINFLWVLSNVMEIYSFNDLQGVVHSVFHSFTSFSKYEDEVIKLLAKITYNYLQICLVQNEIDEKEVENASNYLAALPSISVIAYEKLKGKYALAVHHSQYELAKEIAELLNEIC